MNSVSEKLHLDLVSLDDVEATYSHIKAYKSQGYNDMIRLEFLPSHFHE